MPDERWGPNPFAVQHSEIMGKRYARNLSEMGDQMKLQQIQSVADIGAKEFEQYGEHGARLAQQLRSDPFGTVKYIDSMGGLGAVTNQLRYGQAIKRSAEMSGMEMDPLQSAALLAEGTTGISQLGAGAANQALAGTREATANAMEALAGGGGGTFGGDGSSIDLNAISALALTNPQVAQALLAVRKADRRPGESGATSVAQMIGPQLTDLNKAIEDLTFIQGIDYKNPSSDAWLSKLFVQTVEPNLAVLPGEEKNVVNASTSRWGDLGVRLKRTFSVSGSFTPETRKMMAEAIWKGRGDRVQSKLALLDSLESEAGSLLTDPRDFQRATLGSASARQRASDLLSNPPDFSVFDGQPGTGKTLPPHLLLSPGMKPEDLIDGELYGTPGEGIVGTWNSVTGNFED